MLLDSYSSNRRIFERTLDAGYWYWVVGLGSG